MSYRGRNPLSAVVVIRYSSPSDKLSHRHSLFARLTFLRAHEEILFRERKKSEHTVTPDSSLKAVQAEILTMESFSVVVNLARISPRFADHGSKSQPTSSSFSLRFLPSSWKIVFLKRQNKKSALIHRLTLRDLSPPPSRVSPRKSCCETAQEFRWPRTRRRRRRGTEGPCLPAWSSEGQERQSYRKTMTTRTCCLSVLRAGTWNPSPAESAERPKRRLVFESRLSYRLRGRLFTPYSL